MDDLLKFFDDQKIIAVIRASDAGDAEAIAKAATDGGIHILEITPTVSQSTKLIESLSKLENVAVGFGSATDGEQVYRAINAGARFVSSLYLDKDILTVCRNHNVLVIQGASTINEAVEAYSLGADLVRLFPINFLGGHAFVKCVRRSFPFLKLIPSGSVTSEDFLDYIKAGATACALGQALCDTSVIRQHQWLEVTERAKQFVEKVESLRVPR